MNSREDDRTLLEKDTSSMLPQPPAAGGVMDEEEIVIQIVSALYGPCESGKGSSLLEQDPEASKIPYTRDVTHILRALLQLQEEGFSASTNNSSNANDDGNNNTATSRRNQRGVVVKQKNATIMKTNSILEQQQQQQQHQDYDEEEDPHMVRLKAIAGGIQGGMKRTSIPIRALHDGWNSMNIVFGDACPGTSKKLHVHYVIFHTTQNGDNASTEVHHVSFSEYDPVVLRRRLTFYQDETTLQQATARVLAKKPKLAKSLLVGGDVESSNNNNENDSMVEKECNHQQERGDAVDDDEQFLLVAKRMGRSQSISDFAEAEDSCIRNSRNDSAHHHLPDNNLRYSGASQSPTTAATITTKRPPRLRSASFEIVLPMMLSFLEVRERVQCRLVCRLWRNIVRDWGVASIIDSTDPTFKHAFNRPFLRGILAHSYSSLHSLRLSDFDELTPEDLHPSLPHLRKLRVLDISRCIHLNDDTLSLLAEHANSTLEVLYIKGLTKVSDAGVGSICKSCRKLTVLDVSNTSISDETGVLIGELTKLRALYMRDNFRLTNKSIDAITANCTKLNQLVLWGCVKLKHLTFEDTTAAAGVPNHKITSFTSGRLVSLSLWGCYSLRDDVAISLGVMTQLRSLIVSECHRLTDNFAIGIAQRLPQLVHLYMRYCKRLTDVGVNAIAGSMDNLYSLDLSFCTKITSASICNLLEARHETLSELRLKECRQLQIVRDPDDDDDDGLDDRRRQQNITRGGRDGQSILKSLKRPTGSYLSNSNNATECNLSVLDARCCGGQPGLEIPYADNDPFVRGMISLGFEQKTPGLFARPARWNKVVQDRLLRQFASISQR